MMRHILFIAILICQTFFGFAQNRVDQPTIVLSDTSQRLTYALGWAIDNSTGKWVSNMNVVYNGECPQNMVSHYNQNFSFIRFAKVAANKTHFYLIIFESLTGEYKYPAIEQEWQSYWETEFAVLDSSSYIDLKKSIAKKEGKNIYMKCCGIGFINSRNGSSYNSQTLEVQINETLKNCKPKKYIDQRFDFNAQSVDGKDIVRFRLPEYYLKDDVLSKEYFEVPLSEFQKLLTLK